MRHALARMGLRAAETLVARRSPAVAGSLAAWLGGAIGAADRGRASERDQCGCRADRGASELAAVDHTDR